VYVWGAAPGGGGGLAGGGRGGGGGGQRPHLLDRTTHLSEIVTTKDEGSLHLGAGAKVPLYHPPPGSLVFGLGSLASDWLLRASHPVFYWI
jgi:hypothetical protein